MSRASPAILLRLVAPRQGAAPHDPSASAGGDLFSFKGVFMQQLPRFLAAAKSVLTPAQQAVLSEHAHKTRAMVDECVKLAPQWAKGYGRKGAALILCGARVRPARPA